LRDVYQLMQNFLEAWTDETNKKLQEEIWKLRALAQG